MTGFFARGERLELNREVPWPKPGVPFWGEDENRLTDAHIDWIRDLGFDLSDAFKTTADFAVEQIAEGGDSSHPDRFALPILYLYRHAVELKLKEIAMLGRELGYLADSNKLQKLLTSEHDLMRIWQRARKAMVAQWPTGDQKDLDIAESYIQALHDTDPDGQRFRYDRFGVADKGGTAKLGAVDTLPELVGLQWVRIRMEELFSLLLGGESGLTDALDTKRELEREYASDYY